MRNSRPYHRPARGVYAIQVPLAVTRKDVRSTNWTGMKESMLESITNSYRAILARVESDVRSKK